MKQERVKSMSISYQYYFNEADRKDDKDNNRKWSNIAMEWDQNNNIEDFVKVNTLSERISHYFIY